MSLSRSSKDHADPLSAILAALGTRAVRCTRLEAAGDWALAFPARARLKFVAVQRGHCWLSLPDAPAHRLTAGDITLLGDVPYTVASDLALPAADGRSYYRAPGEDVLRLGGDDTVMLGGGIPVEDDRMRFLLDALPRAMVIAAPSPWAAFIASTLARIADEAGQSRPGGALVTARLADVLLVEAVRATIADRGAASPGWIGALADRHVGDALRLMHGDVGHPWTVATLATRVGLSRSAFASRFARVVGRPPLDYLRQWRMALARQALGEGGSTVATVAAGLGYTSQSAFGHAYKRTFGLSPRRHERRRAEGPPFTHPGDATGAPPGPGQG